MFNELSKRLDREDLDYFLTVEVSKIDIATVSRFLVNPDIKDFLIEYMWEVAAPDLFIDLIENVSISSRHMKKAFDLLDQDGIFYIVLPSGKVVSWI